MKTVRILIFATIILSPSLTISAQEANSGLAVNIAAFERNTNVVWGLQTNGVRAGLEIIKPGHNGNGYPKTTKGILYFQSFNTNPIASKSIFFRVHYKTSLYKADGNSAKLRSEDTSMYSKSRVTGLRYKETSNIEFFSIPDTFEIRTNGIYHLVISMQAATNKLLKNCDFIVTR